MADDVDEVRVLREAVRHDLDLIVRRICLHEREIRSLRRVLEVIVEAVGSEDAEECGVSDGVDCGVGGVGYA